MGWFTGALRTLFGRWGRSEAAAPVAVCGSFELADEVTGTFGLAAEFDGVFSLADCGGCC